MYAFVSSSGFPVLGSRWRQLGYACCIKRRQSVSASCQAKDGPSNHPGGWVDSGDVPVPEKKPLNLGDTLRAKINGSNIYLSGLQGSRKGEVGQIVAQSLGYKFLDLENMLVTVCRDNNLTVKAEKELEGPDVVAKMESEQLKVLETTRMKVIVVNPEAAIRRENWGVLHSGIVVYLDGPIDVLAKRAIQTKEAYDWFGIDLGAPEEEVEENTEIELEVLYNQLYSMWQSADIKVSVMDLDGQEEAELGLLAGRVIGETLRKIDMVESTREEKRRFRVKGTNQRGSIN